MHHVEIHDSRSAVILTALEVEYRAVRAHLTDIREEKHPQGTIYEIGRFDDGNGSWSVGIQEIGAGQSRAAQEAERAIQHFNPSVALFVGVAGGLKDVELGDVVAAAKVYGYEAGKATRSGFKPRPEFGELSYPIGQRARAEKKKSDWLKRIIGNTTPALPRVHEGPIAAGEKVVAGTRSAVYRFLRNEYDDAIAVEMEGIGFLTATHANPGVHALVIRGISDLIQGKSDADKAGFQEIASNHASAFAFEVLAKLGEPDPERTKSVKEDHDRMVPSSEELNPDLMKQLDDHRMILWLGPDFAAQGSENGPSFGEIAQELADTCDYPENWPRYLLRVGQHYALDHGTEDLRKEVLGIYARHGEVPGNLHRLVVNLPLQGIITTAHDTALEKACARAKILHYTAESLTHFCKDPYKTSEFFIIHLLGKIHGTESPVLTEDELRDVLRRNDEILRRHLSMTAWLFIGWDPGYDTLFDHLLRNILDKVHLVASRHLVWSHGPTAIEKARERQGFAIHRHDQERFLRLVKANLPSRPTLAAAPLPGPDISGWKSLDPYASKDHAAFWGRTVEISELLLGIEVRRLTVLTGPSGIGKTSLIHAGLIPRIRECGHHAVYVRITTDPAAATRSAIAQQLPPEIGSCLRQEITDFHFFMLDTFGVIDSKSNLYLFLDQFEATFLLSGPRRFERFSKKYIEALNSLLRERKNLHLIFSLREDYVEQLWDIFPKRMKKESQLESESIHGLSADGARAVIEKTAGALSLTLDPALTQAILDDLGREVGSIDPTALNIICDAVHRKCKKSRHLSLATYRETLGGPDGILGGHLNEALKQIADKFTINVPGIGVPAVARKILMRLTTPDNTSRIESRESLLDYLEEAAANRQLASEVLDYLIYSRLVRSGGQDHTLCELAHDYLAKSIVPWFDEDQESRVIQNQMLLSTREYEESRLPLTEGQFREIARHKNILMNLDLNPDQWEILLLSSLRAGSDDTFWLRQSVQRLPQETLRRVLLKTGENSVAPITHFLEIAGTEIAKNLFQILIQIKSKDIASVWEKRYLARTAAWFTISYPFLGSEVDQGRIEGVTPQDHCRSDQDFENETDDEWVYQTVSSLSARKDSAIYPKLLGCLLEESDQESERFYAARLLGAFGNRAPLGPLFSALADSSSWVQESVRGALVEIGETAGEELMLNLESLSERARRSAFRVLRSLVDSLRTSDAFRWLCYCIARKVLVNGDHPDILVEAGCIFGYFDPDGDDHALLNRIEPPIAIRVRGAALIQRATSRDSSTLLHEVREEAIAKLTRLFCLFDLPSVFITELSQRALSYQGLRSVFEGIGASYRIPDAAGNSSPIEEILDVVESCETAASTPELQRRNGTRFIAMVQRQLGLEPRPVFFPPFPGTENWRSWVRRICDSESQEIVFKPLPKNYPKIRFTKKKEGN